ncbi:spermidine/putrescine ABC transporter ATP-binding protein [Ureibacillus massiliensis 4400831 = CIP 108448 = CCUG 49529]|uniref:Spermidine/putrescine ABC transporter ATP-binding protein n=1 Tax=Ureibacillus massiliensis 4400831 = CIP 108448 = CCUG 49529 TaxID=1211035 RepID=A0A0A3JYX7_9BACL|nr:ABC transporter ATP-binding protein [Ureibacillus massiliensis]KGR92202.1 spermidine/putrescine ABC transporter ATP-binding protein [Ureibacillus massiliensis 4400831 = CIP 108448 = CCUG 49529]
MSFLTVSNVHHTYFSSEAATEALQDINLSIEKSEFVSFVGPSGCGKTTLLSIIAGLFQPTAGKVLIEDQDVFANADLSIGYMLQQDYLFPWKTIEENVTLGLKLLNKNKEESKGIASTLLEDVGLPSIEKKYPRELSGGMRQRVALARTLAVDPKILLLDEPFSALDYQSKLKLEDLVHKLMKEYGKTAVLVTHDIGEAIAMSDRIFLFSPSPGRLYQTFEVPADLKNLTPFEARSHSSYSELFQTIWKELESLEHQ